MSIQCTKVVHLAYMYRSGRTEVVHTMYRNGHVPNWSYPEMDRMTCCGDIAVRNFQHERLVFVVNI